MTNTLQSRPRTITLVVALVATMLATMPTRPVTAAPTGAVTISGFDTTPEGSPTRGQITVRVPDRTGLGLGHPLRVALTLTTASGTPVSGQTLSARISGGASHSATTNAAGQTTVPTPAQPPLLLADDDALLDGGVTIELQSQLDAGDYRIEAQLVDWDEPFRRRAGATRIETAVAATQTGFGPSVPVAYIATSQQFPDALAGGAAAARADAPVLLTTSDALPVATRDELARLRPAQIVVLGGPAAISDDVVGALRPLTSGEVSRRFGETRIDTAVAVSQASWPNGADTVVVAAASSFADALTGGALAARSDAPVLLVGQSDVPAQVAAEITRLDPDTILVIGGPVVLTESVLTQLRDTNTGVVRRLAGEDRYATSIVAAGAVPDASGGVLVVATGENFPDALAGVALAGVTDGALLLTRPTVLRSDTAATVARIDPDRIVLLGGETAVTSEVNHDLREIVRRRTIRPTRLIDAAGSRAFTVLTAPASPTPTEGETATESESPTPTPTETATETETPTPTETEDPVAPTVDITAPTQAEPATIDTGTTTTVTFTTDIAGDYAITLHPTGTSDGGEVATGIATVGSNDVVVTGDTAGTYDVIVDVTSADELTGSDTETAALTVTEPPTPTVVISSPTNSSPVSVTEGDPTTATFTTDVAGVYNVFLRRTDTETILGPVATGDAPAGTPVDAGFNAPADSGSYDVIVSVTSSEERTGQDTEIAALDVTDNVTVPDVQIDDPTGASPAVVASGQAFDITFTVDRAGTYTLEYTTSGGGTWTPFPGGSGLLLAAGQKVVSVASPTTVANPVLDIRVRFVAGLPTQTVFDVEEQAVIGLPAPDIGASRACTLGRENPALPGTPGIGGDPLDPAHCLLPFPSNLHTLPTATPGLEGDNDLRINFLPTAMPRNRAGKLVDPTEWNRNDGFSPGTTVMTVVEELDLARTWNPADPAAFEDLVTTPARSLAEDAPMVIVDLDTGLRHPFWAELDSHPTTLAEGWPRTLILRPLVHFTEGHRYAIGLRNLRDSAGEVIPAGDAFTYYRDDAATNPFPGDLGFAARRGIVQDIISDLENTTTFDRDVDEIFLAWDFTVASGVNLAGRLLHIRDDAFADLGDTDLADGIVAGASPGISITQVIPGSGDKLVTVKGDLTVPLYLREPQSTNATVPDFPGCNDLPDPLDVICGQDQAVPGARFYYANPGDEFPSRNPIADTLDVPYVCNIPVTAFDGTTVNPSRVALYGHGLLGSKGESEGGSTGRMRTQENQTHCALNWFGFASQDIGNIAAVLTDYSNFPSVADRVQQGFLNWQFLARALVHQDGLVDVAAPDGSFPFRAGGTAEGEVLIRTDEVFYEGNSQGGILGGGLLAIAPDVLKGTFGVPATNYSTLLNRSVDFEGSFVDSPFPVGPSGIGYGDVYYASYPDAVDEQVGFGLLQMLWDRAEGNGFAQHTTDNPYPNTPAHQVLLHPAFGDYQVANVAAEVQARTYGAAFLDHSLEPGLHWSDDPLFGFTSLSAQPDARSALVYWDSGNPAPPNVNVPPEDHDQDPHSDPRKDPNSGRQRALFYETGQIVDVLPGAPYHTYVFPSRACNDESFDPRGICPP